MHPSKIRNLLFLVVLLPLSLWAIVTAANFVIEYNWWKEVGQVGTWVSMLWYSIAPFAVGAVVALVALWMAHARGLSFAGIRRDDFILYSRLSTIALAIVAMF